MTSTGAHPVDCVQSSPEHYNDQEQSPLFSKLPGEIRDRIFTYALADYEDTSKSYDNNTCFKRPNYLAPRRTDTVLLCTCQRVYKEAWFRPFTTAEHTFWLAWNGRRPAKVLTRESLRSTLSLIHSLHGDIEMDHVRVFSQMCYLSGFDSLLSLDHLNPRRVTLTIRHTDWPECKSFLHQTCPRIGPQTDSCQWFRPQQPRRRPALGCRVLGHFTASVMSVFEFESLANFCAFSHE